jgi:RNA polymerase sigma factor (sigma-70 family)
VEDREASFAAFYEESYDSVCRALVIAFRVAVRHRRHRDPDVDVPPERDVADRIVDRESISVAVGALPPRQRLAIVLRYGLDLPLEDVATAMGCAVGTAKSTLHAALTRLGVTLDAAVREVEHDGR